MSITKKLVVTLEDDVATPSERIFIYKGDVGVDIIIELENFNYKIDSISEKNMINRIEAYFKTPQGIVKQYNNEVDVINGDRIKFSFSKNVINDMQIIGQYELQFHLFDKEDNRITIPSYFFYVKEPLHKDSSDEGAVVGYATVDYSKVQDDDVVLFAIDENGYIKTDWKIGDIITASKLNKIETQLARVTSNAKELNDKLNLKSDAEHTHSQYTTRIDLENYIGENKDLLKGDKGDQGLPGINGQNGEKGDKGDKGEDGLTTAILVNGQTYTHNNGTITLPNYPTVPTKTSELTNDSSYATETYVTTKIAEASLSGGQIDLSGYATKDDLNTKEDKVIGKGLSTNDLTNELKANYDVAYTHSQSTHAPINAQKNSDITKGEIEAKLIGNITTHTHNQYLTEHQDISKLATKTELNNKVDKIDGMGLSTNDYTTEEKNKLSGIEEGANNYTHPSSHNATMIIGDSTHRFVTDTEKSTWNNKSNFSGNYNDLTNKPTIPTVTNDLTNELKSNYDTAYTHSQSTHAPSNAQKNSNITKGEIEAKLIGDITSHTHSQYLTEHQDISNLALKSELPTQVSELTNDSNFATETFVTTKISEASLGSSFSGSYNDLTDKPTIPTKTSDLANDSGYLTSIPNEYVTETELESKGYLTEHQDISGLATKSELDSKVDKVTGKGLSTNDLTNTLKSNYDTAYTHSQTSHITTDNVNTAVANYVDEHKAELKGDKGDVGESGKDGSNGKDGTTFTPSVDLEGNLSWTNNGGLTNPTTVNIKGNDGTKGDKGDKGDRGEHGQDGITPTLSIGTVITGNESSNASVTIGGSSPNYTLNFTIPKGDKGDKGEVGAKGDKGDIGAKGDKGDTGANGQDGITPTLSIGTVTTGVAGSNATVTMTGNSPNYILNFAIPKGDKGDNGSDANVNLSGYQTKTDNTLNTTNKTIVGAINEVKASIPTDLPANGGNADTVSGYTIWVGTQSEYDAIGSKSSTTIYFIKG